MNLASRKPGGTGRINESNLWNKKPFTGQDAMSLASLFRVHRSSLLMGTNLARRYNCAIRLSAALCVQLLDLLPLRSGQKTLLLQDGQRQGYASKRQSYEICRMGAT